MDKDKIKNKIPMIKFKDISEAAKITLEVLRSIKKKDFYKIIKDNEERLRSKKLKDKYENKTKTNKKNN